jgi:anaerobic selenocysteine-containing dehydrogenase
MMDFEGKDKIKSQIQENAVMLQQFQAAMQIIQQAAMVDPMVGQMAMQAGLIAPEQMQAMAQQASAPGGQPESSTPEERAARATAGGDNSQAAKARVRAANAALPR